MATKAPENKLNMIAESSLVMKLLLSLDRRTRNYGIKHFIQLLLKHSGDTNDAFQLENYLLIWNGLFYFLWTSDKPLNQESALKKISNLIHSCTSYQGKILFMNAFFHTIKNGQFMLHHTDQFMMLLRRCLRQFIFTYINYDWNLEYTNKVLEILYRALKFSTHSLKTHLRKIYVEELVKASRGNVRTEALLIIIDSM